MPLFLIETPNGDSVGPMLVLFHHNFAKICSVMLQFNVGLTFRLSKWTDDYLSDSFL